MPALAGLRVRERTLGTNLSAALGSTAGRVIFGFAASVIVTRSLGAAGRGQFSFVLTTLSLLVMLGGAGSFAAVTTSSARHGRCPAQLYPATAALAAGMAVGFGAAFLLAFVAFRDSLFSGVSMVAAVAVVVALIPTLVLNYWTAVAALDDRLVSFSIGSLAGSVVYLLGVGVLAATGSLSAGTALSLWIVGSLAPLATVVRWRRLVPRPRQRNVVRELLHHAMRANVGDIAMLMVLRADVLVIKGYRGFTEVGIYAVATGVAELVLQAGSCLRVAFLRQQGRATDRVALAALLARSTRLVLAAGLLGVTVVVLLARPFITMAFGPEFAGAGVAAAILAPGVLAVTLQGVLRDYLLVEGATVVPTVTAAVSLVLNITLNVVLLRNHSYLVAAMTSTLAYVVNFGACAWCFCRLTGTPLRRLVVPQAGDVATLHRLLPKRG